MKGRTIATMAPARVAGSTTNLPRAERRSRPRRSEAAFRVCAYEPGRVKATRSAEALLGQARLRRTPPAAALDVRDSSWLGRYRSVGHQARSWRPSRIESHPSRLTDRPSNIEAIRRERAPTTVKLMACSRECHRARPGAVLLCAPTSLRNDVQQVGKITAIGCDVSISRRRD
jgi:hypothetical protein